MKKIGKILMCFLLFTALLVESSELTFARESFQDYSTAIDEKALLINLIKNPEEINKFKEIWIRYEESGVISIVSGQIFFSKEKDAFSELDMIIAEVICQCNYAFSIGILSIDESNQNLEIIDLASENEEIQLLTRLSREDNEIAMLSMMEDELAIAERISIKPAFGLNRYDEPGSHYCVKDKLDIIGLCKKNYNEINTFYLSMVAAAIVSAGVIHPIEATIAYWVNKVKSGGDWDYKQVPGYAPYSKTFCTFYDGVNYHRTSEYIGNFNYGYTGKFLFPLPILYAGSFAVAKFDPKDTDDWPAISDGFNHAP